MNFIQEVLNLLERKQDKKKLDINRDYFEFGRTKPSSIGNPLYNPKMVPHAIKYKDFKCETIKGLVSGTGTEHTLPVWSTIDSNNCNVQTIIDSVFSQDATATEGKVSADFRVTGNTVLEGNLLVLGTQTIVESTIVEVADNIMRINSGGAGVDAGIEVIQPGGTRTWAWDNAKELWSTFSHSIETKDIVINRAIIQDGETLVNVVNEAEGLASNDNDESYATVAAIIDWTDQMDLEVSADTGTPLDILLNSETLQIRGGSNITTVADGNEKIKIDLDNDITVSSVTTKFLTLEGSPAPYQVTSIVNDYAAVDDPNITLLTAKAIVNYIDDQRDYVNNVVLTGTDLTFTGVNNAFSGTIDLSSLLDNTNLARIISGAVVGTDLVLTRDDASDISIDLSSIGNTTPVMSATVTGTGKLWDDTVQVEDAALVTAVPQRTYGVQFNDAQQLVVNVPWIEGSGVTSDNVTDVSVLVNPTPADAIGLRVFDSTTTPRIELDFNGVISQYINGAGELTTFPTINPGTVTSFSASLLNGDSLSVAVADSTSTPSANFTWGGTASQYINGEGDLQTFPAIPVVPFTSLTTTGTSGAATLTSGVLNIPEYAGGGTDNCTYGLIVPGNDKSIATTFKPIQSSGNLVLGYKNTSGARQSYANTISISFQTLASTKTYAFEINFTARIAAGVIVLHTFEDSFYSETDKVVTKSYTYYSPNLEDDGEIYVNARSIGINDLTIKSSSMAVVSSSCEATNDGTMTVITG